MKVMLDVNVLVDICGESEDFALSLAALDVAIDRNFIPCMLASMSTLIHYVVCARGYRDKKGSIKALKELSKILDVLDVTESDMDKALRSRMIDFEDALIAEASYRHNLDIIITRNKRDFKKSPVPAMTPAEFVYTFKSADREYGIIDL